MSGTQKPKTNKGVRNDARNNGKAAKQHVGSRGSRRNKMTELDKVLMGKGLASKWRAVIDGKKRGLPGRPLTTTNRQSQD